MKKIKTVFLITIGIALSIPIIFFNFEKNCASPIDNRMLTEWEMDTDDFTGMVDSYIKDRIGFRTQAIDTYTVLHDRMFHLMVHPSYTYGEDGYVFFKMGEEYDSLEFTDNFCSYLRKVQDYCEERGVPFLYCLNPSKTTIYSQYLPKGYQYYDTFNLNMYKSLEKFGVHYITNETILKEKSETEQVYNVKYDAGHWNDLGAFYGTNHILEELSKEFPNVRERTKEDFEINTVVMTSLPVSHFEIEEEVPYFNDKSEIYIEEKTEEYGALNLDENYHEMRYLVNHAEGAKDLPRVLVFQGSYYNDRHRFLQSSFEEYYAVHNYMNFLNFDYYFNIFQPEYVILETAEYATRYEYFPWSSLTTKEFNPVLEDEKSLEANPLKEYTFSVEEDGSLVTLTVELEKSVERGYLLIKDKQFDFSINKETNEAVCTIDKKYEDFIEAKVYFE